MEVALLTATLAAEVARFETNLASADRMIANTREGLRGLERDALAANLALKSVGGPAGDAAAKLREVKIPAGQVAETVAGAGSMRSAVDRIADAARPASAALRDIRPSAAAIPELAAVKAEVEGVRDAALEAAAATRLIGTGGAGPSRFIPGSYAGMGGLGRYIPGPGQQSGFGYAGDFTARSSEQAAIDYLARHGIDRNGNFIGDGGGGFGGGDGRGGPGGGGGFFSGILPGGRRAGAGAVTTAIGLGIAASPALIPAAGGLATAAAAGMTTLIGAAGTLKLAFADLTSAAFTTQKAFDQLTPVQQRFVTTLRSLDAGLLKGNLEPLAQRTLLPQLTAAIHAAFTPAAVSSLQRGVAGFSNAIGGGAQQLGALFGSSGFQAQFGTMLQQDAGYLRSFLDGLTHLIDAFVRIQVAAGPFLTWLSTATTNLAKWVDNAVKADQANGRLAGFFSEAKTALEALGNLVGSIAGAIHSLVQAFGGFNFAINVINTLSRVFDGIGRFLNQNRNLLRDFFAGALGAINNVLTVVSSLLSQLAPLGRAIDAIAKGIGGWKVAIDGAIIAFTAWALITKVNPWLTIISATIIAIGELVNHWNTLGSTVRALLAGLTAAWIAFLVVTQVNPWVALITATVAITAFIVTHWKQVTQALPILWKAAWDAIKGVANVAVYYMLSLVELFLKTLKAAFSWIPNWLPFVGGVKSALNSAIGFIEQFHTRGINDLSNAGQLAGQGFGTLFASGVAKGLQAATGMIDKFGNLIPPVGLGTPSGRVSWPGRVSQQGTSVGTLPPSLALPQNLQRAVDAAQAGHGSMAAANARAYAYYEKLLATPGLTAAQKDALYKAEAQYAPQSAFGTPAPLQGGTSGLGLLPQAQQQAIANQQALVAQQTAGTATQRQALQGLIADYQKAAEWLAKQHGTATQMTAIDKERATLAKEIASAQHQIATSLHQQFTTTLAQHQQALSQAMATFATGIGQGTTPQQQLAAANALIKVADTQRRQLDTLLSQATTEKERLAVQRELLSVEKDIARARRVQATARLTEQDLRTLGIAGTPGAPGLQSLRTREREILLQEVARFVGPVKGETAQQRAAGLIPDAVTAPLDRLIKEMQAAGITIPKSTLDSLHKINEVLNRHEKLGAKLNDLVSQNVTGRLAQINDTLKSMLTGTALSNYVVPSERQLTAGLTGLTPGQRKQIGERLAEVAEFHGKVPSGPAALGIPLGPGGQTLTSGPVTVVHVHGGITVSIPPEAARNPRRIAEEIRHELLKTARRNPTQTRGPNAGRNVGMN